MNDRLKIIAADSPSTNSKRNQREETREKFEHLWKVDPKLFDPMQSAMQKERIERTWKLIKSLPLKGKQAVDLGCGTGILAKHLAEEGALVLAVDVAPTALKQIEELHIENLKTRADCVPNTLLPDEGFDIVISTELIAYLPSDQYRLYFSELARIVRQDGFVICSTEIDTYSEDALQRFLSLSETEFKMEKWVFSYHALYIRLSNLVNAPLWKPIAFILRPLSNLLKNNRSLLLALEKICHFFSSENGISHVTWIGSRRALIESPPPEQEIPKERKQRRFVWE